MGTELSGNAEFVEMCFLDTAGMRRCRIFTRKHMAGVIKHGFGLAACVPFFPIHMDVPPSESKYDALGEFRVIPDMTTLKVLPWRKSTAHAFTNLHDQTGEVARECPRSILHRAVANLRQEFDYELKVGFETEFILLDKNIQKHGCLYPRSEHNYGSQNDMVIHAEVMEHIVRTLEEMDIDVIHFHPESAVGQYEIATGPADPLTACDSVLLTRLAIGDPNWFVLQPLCDVLCTVAIAHQHGFEVSFLPKFFGNAAGNGGHVHMSLSKDGVDVSRCSTAMTLSSETQYFIKGMLDHQAAWMIWTSTIPNSFKRNQAGCWTSGYNTWGINNREAMIRILFPVMGEQNSIRFEQRCFDQTATPHLGVAALIVAGILGLRKKKILPPITQVAPQSLSESELEEREAKPYPASISEAVDKFNDNKEFKDAMTEISSSDFVTSAMECRKAAEMYFVSAKPDEEVKSLYNKY